MNSDDRMIQFALGENDFQAQAITIVYPLRQENHCGSLYVSGPKDFYKMGTHGKLFYCGEVLLLSLQQQFLWLLLTHMSVQTFGGTSRKGGKRVEW